MDHAWNPSLPSLFTTSLYLIVSSHSVARAQKCASRLQALSHWCTLESLGKTTLKTKDNTLLYVKQIMTGPTVQHRELHSTFYNNPWWKRIWKIIDIYIYHTCISLNNNWITLLYSCCCCCCCVASVVSDSMQPHRWQPTRLPHPWDSPGKNTGVGCYFLLQCMKVKSEREVAQSGRLLGTPWTAAFQAPPSMGFSRQEYWSGCHCLLLKHCKSTILQF